MVTSLTSSGEPCSFVALSPRPLSASRMHGAAKLAGQALEHQPAPEARRPGGRSNGRSAPLSPDNYQMVVVLDARQVERAARDRKRAILDRVGRQLVDHQRERCRRGFADTHLCHGDVDAVATAPLSS